MKTLGKPSRFPAGSGVATTGAPPSAALDQAYWSAKQAAAYLGIALSYLHKLTSQGRIPHYKPGGKLLYFKPSELAAWIERSKVRSRDELAAEALTVSGTRAGGHR
jgi:excisionase family DNA binding protein